MNVFKNGIVGEWAEELNPPFNFAESWSVEDLFATGL